MLTKHFTLPKGCMMALQVLEWVRNLNVLFPLTRSLRTWPLCLNGLAPTLNFTNDLHNLYTQLLLFQIILGHENSEPRITWFPVHLCKYSVLLRRVRCCGTLDYWLETVFHTSRCPVFVTTSRYVVTAFRCQVHVQNLF